MRFFAKTTRTEETIASEILYLTYRTETNNDCSVFSIQHSILQLSNKIINDNHYSSLQSYHPAPLYEPQNKVRKYSRWVFVCIWNIRASNWYENLRIFCISWDLNWRPKSLFTLWVGGWVYWLIILTNHRTAADRLPVSCSLCKPADINIRSFEVGINSKSPTFEARRIRTFRLKVIIRLW